MSLSDIKNLENLPPYPASEAANREAYWFKPELLHNRAVEIDVEADSQGDGVVVEFEMGRNRYQIIDIRPSTQSGSMNINKFGINPSRGAHFLITEGDLTYQYETPQTGMKGVGDGEQIQLGRNHYQDRFIYDQQVSRDHLSVTYKEGKLKLEDTSTNGTMLVDIREPFTLLEEEDSTTPEASAAYEAAAKIFDKTVREEIAKEVGDRFFSKEYDEIGQLLEEKGRLTDEFLKVADNVLDPRYREINEKIESINAQLNEYGQTYYDFIEDRITLLSLQQTNEESGQSFEIQNDLAPKILQDVIMNGEVIRAGQEGIFVLPESLKSATNESPSIDLNVDRKQPVEVPTDAFVSATGFESWKHGRGYGHGSRKDGRTSRDVMEDYAQRDTELPAVTDAIVYVASNGEYFIKTNNSHRVGAAKIKNQPTMQLAGQVKIALIEAIPRSLQSDELSRQ